MDFSKITKNFTYLTVPDIVSPPQDPRRIRFSSKAAKQRTADRLKARLFKLAKDKQRKKDRKAFKTFLMDSGATSHYTRPSDGLPIIGASRKRVMVANGATIQATAQTELPFPLTKQARVAEVLPDLNFNSLVSVGKLADSGYTTNFSPYDKGVSIYPSEGIDIIEHGRALIKGWRDDSSGLWRVSAEVDDHQNFMSDAP